MHFFLWIIQMNHNYINFDSLVILHGNQKERFVAGESNSVSQCSELQYKVWLVHIPWVEIGDICVFKVIGTNISHQYHIGASITTTFIFLLASSFQLMSKYILVIFCHWLATHWKALNLTDRNGEHYHPSLMTFTCPDQLYPWVPSLWNNSLCAAAILCVWQQEHALSFRLGGNDFVMIRIPIGTGLCNTYTATIVFDFQEWPSLSWSPLCTAVVNFV